MKLSIYQPLLTSFDVPFEFPLFRSRLIGEYNIGRFKKEYWKFESNHKVTKITEEMSQTTILTYDDINADFVKDMMCKDMVYGDGEYDIIPERIYDTAVQRLIDKLYKA